MDTGSCADHDPLIIRYGTLWPAYQDQLGANDQQPHGMAHHGAACTIVAFYHLPHRGREQPEGDMDTFPSLPDTLFQPRADISFQAEDQREEDATADRAHGHRLQHR